MMSLASRDRGQACLCESLALCKRVPPGYLVAGARLLKRVALCGDRATVPQNVGSNDALQPR